MSLSISLNLKPRLSLSLSSILNLKAGTLDAGQEGRNVVTDITLLAESDYFIGALAPKPNPDPNAKTGT